MADPYHRAKGGRLTFKGGSVASFSKSIDKKKHKKSKNKDKHKPTLADDGSEFQPQEEEDPATGALGGGVGGQVGGEKIYTIDAAKKMNYEELFPVEAKKFGYHDSKPSNFSSVEEALDHRVKKKADRYCK